MAYEQRPGFAPKPVIDIRIVRLVVSLMQCEPLSGYYFNAQKMDFACTYNQIDFRSVVGEYSEFPISQESLGLFFQWLHKKDQPKFARFIAYTMRGVLAEYGTPPYWSGSNTAYFEDFVKDLRALGYEYKWKGGADVAVTPVVLGGEEDARLSDELDEMLGGLNPKLVETRRGAWDALLSGGEDSERQAIASSRQLLAETLRTATKGETREKMVRAILKDKDAKMVESVGDLVNSVYDLQSKGEHAKPNFDRALFVIKL